MRMCVPKRVRCSPRRTALHTWSIGKRYWILIIFHLFFPVLFDSQTLYNVIVSIFHNELHAMQSLPTPPNSTELFGAFPLIGVFNYDFATNQAPSLTLFDKLTVEPDYGRLLFWIANSIASKHSRHKHCLRFLSFFLFIFNFNVSFSSYICITFFDLFVVVKHNVSVD